MEQRRAMLEAESSDSLSEVSMSESGSEDDTSSDVSSSSSGRSQSRRRFSSSRLRQHVSRNSRSVSPPRRLERRGFYLTTRRLRRRGSHRLDAMIPVQFHRLVGAYAVLFRHLVDAYAVILVPFHPLADMDAVAPVRFHLCPVVAVTEDTLMTSKTYIYGVNYCVSYAMITVVSQRKSQ